LTFVPGSPEVRMGVRRHRRYSTEFKLCLVEAYLAGEGSANGVAKQYGIPRSLVLIWAEKYRKGELTLDVQREEQLLESEQKIAALERKVGQLTMELDLLKKGLAAAPSPSSGPSSIISGPGVSPLRGGAA
jgi:transposase